MSGVEEQSPPDCPFCAVRSEFLYTIDRFTDPFPIYRCPRCKLQMRATDASPHRFYTEEYYTGKAEYAYVDERSQRRFFEAVWDARLKTIKKHVPPPADFLDVGCAFGGFALCAGKHGYRPRGLDISPYAVKEANQGGLDARVGELCDLYTSKERYDVVTLIEVIEHIADPIRAFETLSRIVRPGGLLVLQTANFDGLQAKRAGSKYHYYLPGHLYYYSKSNLRTILKRYGFETDSKRSSFFTAPTSAFCRNCEKWPAASRNGQIDFAGFVHRTTMRRAGSHAVISPSHRRWWCTRSGIRRDLPIRLQNELRNGIAGTSEFADRFAVHEQADPPYLRKLEEGQSELREAVTDHMFAVATDLFADIDHCDPVMKLCTVDPDI